MDLVIFHSAGGWAESGYLISVKHNVLLLHVGVGAQTYSGIRIGPFRQKSSVVALWLRDRHSICWKVKRREWATISLDRWGGRVRAIALVLKTSIPLRVSWVRIPPSPPYPFGLSPLQGNRISRWPLSPIRRCQVYDDNWMLNFTPLSSNFPDLFWC